MPDLPETDAHVAPQVQPSADLPMDVTPNALGAGVGAALENDAEVATKIHHDALDRANQIAVLDADNQANAKSEALLRDPKTGVLNTFAGKDAPAVADKALADFDDHVSKTMDTLTNDQQKLSFQRMAQARRFDMQRTLDGYEHDQGEQYAKQVHDGAIAGTVNDAVHGAGDPAAISDALARQRALMSDYGKGRMSQDEIDASTAHAASATHLAVIEHLNSTGNDQAAKAWFDANKDGLRGKDLTDAGKMVEAGSLAGQSQRIADTITVDKDGTVLSRAEIDDKIRTDPRLQADPKLRDEVQARADRRLAQAHEEHQEDQKSTIDGIMRVAQSSPQGLQDPAAVTALTRLDPENADRVRARFTKDANVGQDPRPLIVQAARDPNGFLESMKDPTLAVTYSKSDLETLLSKQREIQTNGTLLDSASILSSEEEKNRALAMAGLGKAKTDDPQRIAYLDALNNRVQATVQATGKKATPETIRKVSDEMAIETAVQPAAWVGYSAAKPVVQLTAAQRDTASRDLSEFAKADPAKAAQIRGNLTAAARTLGMDTTKLTDDQYNRAFAQHLIVKDLMLSGDRVGAQHATDRLAAILSERGKATAPTVTRTAHQQALDAMRQRSGMDQ